TRRVALLSRSLARALYGDEDPLGRRLAPVLGDWDDATDWWEVVGVVGDIRLEGLDAEARGTLYLPTPQLPQPAGTLVLRTTVDPSELAGPVRRAMLEAEPRLLVPTIQTLGALRAESLARRRFDSVLLGMFSLLALTLSAVGIYGLLSYSVATRRFELNLRMAFGADRNAVVGLVVREGMRLVGLGLLVGLAGALLATPSVAGLLFGIEPTDPVTYGGTVLGVAATALVGCLIPALRAAAGDPLGTLRRE
ncbi:MAG TPA: FtsX-like permease family protein, partial [Longimicrobiales bacterium]|nr:FtsX-like permease family protein [Longimicrobiales bacterium]